MTKDSAVNRAFKPRLGLRARSYLQKPRPRGLSLGQILTSFRGQRFAPQSRLLNCLPARVRNNHP